MRHDSFALLAPKNRNNRNQEFEKKSVKEKPRILFFKNLEQRCTRPRDPRQSKRDGFLQHFLNPFNETASNAWPNIQAHASECSFSSRFRLVPNPNNPPVTGLEHRTIGKRTPKSGYRRRHPSPGGTFRVLGVFHYGLSLLMHELEQIVGTPDTLAGSAAPLPAPERLRTGPRPGRSSTLPVSVGHA